MKGTVTKKGNRYYPIFDIGRNPATNERRQKWGPGFDKKRDAEKWLSEAISQVNKGNYITRSKETVSQWCEEWLESYATIHVRPNVKDSYCQVLRTHLIPYLGAELLSSLTAVDLDSRYADMLANGLSPTTANYLHRIIHKLLKTAVKKGKISHNVAEDADPPKQTRPIITVWNVQELITFIETARKYKPDLFPIFALLIFTGSRVGEALGSQFRDMSLHTSHPKWSVQRTVYKRHNGEWLINKPKTSKSKRSIDLPPSLVLTLIRLREQREADAEYFNRAFSEDDFVFTRPDSRLYDPRFISQVFRRITKIAGLKPIRLHDLRHTHATLLLSAGTNPKIVSERLGHASVAITLDIYSHVLPGIQEQAATVFDDMIIKASENITQKLVVRKMLEEGKGIESEPCRDRTCDPQIKSLLLYQLS